MPYQNEYARLDTATRVLTRENLREQIAKLSIKKSTLEHTKEIINQFKPAPLGTTAFKQFHALDGSLCALPLDNGFPGGEIAVLMAGIISADYNMLKELDKNRPFNPQKWQASFKNYQSSFLISGHNISSEEYSDPADCFRAHLAHGLGNSKPVGNYDLSLLDTLRNSLPNPQTACPNPTCGQAITLPQSNEALLCKSCNSAVWTSDWLQLQRFYRELGPSGDLFTESMSALERIFLLHFLSSGTASKDDIVIVDGPLGGAEYDSPTEKMFWHKLEQILKNDNAPAIIGVEKMGQLAQHFDNLEKMSINHNIAIAPRSFVVLNDDYVNTFLHPHARKSHTGHPKIKKILYKNARNSNIVLHVPKDERQNEKLGNIFNFLDEQTSGRFANALVPLTLAHEQVSLTSKSVSSKLFNNSINFG